MSIDNGVYILQCRDQFRVKAIDNIHWSFLDELGMTNEVMPSRMNVYEK